VATHRHGSSRPGHRDLGRQQRHAVAPRGPERLLRELRNGRGVARSLLERGAIVLARVPFAERDESKVRPAVVVCTTGDVVIVRPVTTSTTMRRRGLFREIVLNHRRCWVMDRLVQLPLTSVVSLLAQAGAPA
jgi:mRNA-degrading endonuclease toxin of MazEF toxin-antitoxin module